MQQFFKVDVWISTLEKRHGEGRACRVNELKTFSKWIFDGLNRKRANGQTF